ncbi:MAG: DUF2063 domain-containing protein [Halioglobus sp.]
MSTTQTLLDSQMAMARFLRDPEGEPAPEGIEARRLKIYQDLIYNNIEGFISSGFPVLRSLYSEADWHELVRLFIDQHRCKTPYFLEISQEFLQFLESVHQPRPCDPPFINELAHYEWVELGLDIAEEELPEKVSLAQGGPSSTEEVLKLVPRLSPLAWLLSYTFPVHMIGPSFRPEIAEEPTFLVVYRNWDDAIKFVVINPAVARLLEMIQNNEGATVRELLTALAGEMNAAVDPILEFGAGQIAEFLENSIVLQTP